MANYKSLKTTINANVKRNGNQEITGQILNSVLNAMVDTLGTGYSFAGVATPATNPGTPDAKVFYIANGKGTYTHFGELEVTEDDVVVLYWDSLWHKESTGIAREANLTNLEKEVATKQNALTDTDGGYGQRVAELERQGIASEEKLTELESDINGKQSETIVNENVPWNTQGFSKKINISAFKGQKIIVKTSSINIDPSYIFNLYLMTGESSTDIVETKQLHVGETMEVELSFEIDYIWLFNSYSLIDGYNLDVEIYTKKEDGIVDDINTINNELNTIKESIVTSNSLNVVQAENQIKVSNKNIKGNTIIITFEPLGVNKLWQIRSVEIYDSSDNLLVKSTTDTDSVGPYHVGAVNNADGDNIGTAISNFTGGCHGYNGDLTGTATASSSVVVNSLGSIVDVVVTNRIQGYNTRKEDGTGREILVEEVHYIFENKVDGFKVNNYIKALEEVTINLYYGMQIAFARQYVKFNSGEVGKWKEQSLNASYDGNSLDSVAGKSNTGLIQEMYVLDRGLGHFGLVPSDIPKVFQSGKIYYNLIRQNVSLEADDTLFFEGGYIFNYVGSPIILGGYYDYQNGRVNSFIPRGTLQTKRYRINIFMTGENMPYNINIYLSSSTDSSGIITTYTNITRDSSNEIELTDAVKYIWLFNSVNSTGRINYTITDVE